LFFEPILPAQGVFEGLLSTEVRSMGLNVDTAPKVIPILRLTCPHSNVSDGGSHSMRLQVSIGKVRCMGDGTLNLTFTSKGSRVIASGS
jgi:hypothetical protein